MIFIELRALSLERRVEVVKLRDAYETQIRHTIVDAQKARVISFDIPSKYLPLTPLNRSIF